MQKQDYRTAYVLQIKRQWRVVIPIRGKLTPKIYAEEFPSRGSAEAWLCSYEGEQAVQMYQSRSVPA